MAACVYLFTTSWPVWPPFRLASHCRAAAARELELGLGWVGGAGLGRTAQPSCQLIVHSFISHHHQTSIRLPRPGDCEMAFTWACFPFPIPRVCRNLQQVLRETVVAWWLGIHSSMYTIYLQYRQCFGVPWFQMLISKLAEEDPWVLSCARYGPRHPSMPELAGV